MTIRQELIQRIRAAFPTTYDIGDPAFVEYDGVVLVRLTLAAVVPFSLAAAESPGTLALARDAAEFAIFNELQGVLDDARANGVPDFEWTGDEDGD